VERQLKQRLVGTAVIATLAVIFLPMMLEGPRNKAPSSFGDNPVPPRPEAFRSRVEPLQPLPPLPAQQMAAVVDGAVREATTGSAGRPDGSSAVGEGEAATAVLEDRPSTTRKGAPLQAWIVQIGSFNRQSNATSLRDRLRKKGYATFVEETTRGARTIYRVRIGPEVSRRKAETMRREIEESMKLKGILVAHSG